MRLKERTYPVIGCTEVELARAMGWLGPARNGGHFAAYTDWVVRYRLRVVDLAITDVDVELDVTMTLPRWTPLRSVDLALVKRWGRYLAALREHELGHLALAERAADDVRAALALDLRLSSPEAIHAAAARAVEAAVAAVREAEREYDARTRDGATQGASFP